MTSRSNACKSVRGTGHSFFGHTELAGDALEIFLRNFESLLAERGWTRLEAAQRIGITPGAITHWFNKKQAPHLSLVTRVARAFNVQVADLFTDPDNLPPEDPDPDQVIRESLRRLAEAAGENIKFERRKSPRKK